MTWTLAQIQDAKMEKLWTRLQALMWLLEPQRLKPLSMRERQDIWYEAREIYREIQRRTAQTQLF